MTQLISTSEIPKWAESLGAFAEPHTPRGVLANSVNVVVEAIIASKTPEIQWTMGIYYDDYNGWGCDLISEYQIRMHWDKGNVTFTGHAGGVQYPDLDPSDPNDLAGWVSIVIAHVRDYVELEEALNKLDISVKGLEKQVDRVDSTLDDFSLMDLFGDG